MSYVVVNNLTPLTFSLDISAKWWLVSGRLQAARAAANKWSVSLSWMLAAQVPFNSTETINTITKKQLDRLSKMAVN